MLCDWLWCFGGIVLTRLKWLAHALAQSLPVTSLMSQTRRLWTGQVVVAIMAELVVQWALVGFHSKVLCVHFGENRRTIVVERFSEAGAVGRRCSVSVGSQHDNYLENLPASADDSTGHMVKVIACWQAVNVLQNTECDASLYSYFACLIWHWHLHLIYLFTPQFDSCLFTVSLFYIKLFINLATCSFSR